MSNAEMHSIHHTSVENNRMMYERLSHYLLAVHYLCAWLEQQWISPTEYRRLEKLLAKRYGFFDKSILRSNVRRRLDK